jgi:hypothetical protein
MVLVALGGSVSTPEAGIDAEIVQLASLDALRAVDPANVKGKIVFINNRMPRRKDGNGYRDTVPARGAAASVAAKMGALAVVIRSVGTDNNRTPHTGAMRYEEGAPRIPAAALSNPDADVLEKEVASGKPVTFHLKLTSRYPPDVEGANVIGEIRGREKPDEVILLGGHLDSWHLGTGAIDDGARLRHHDRGGAPYRSAAGEAAADHPRHPLRQRGARPLRRPCLRRGARRRTPEAHPGRRVGPRRRQDLPPLLPGRPRDPPRHGRDPQARGGIERGDNTSTEGSDLSPLIPAKVPILGFSQDATSYFDWHHTANDTLDKIDAKDLDQNVAAWAAAAWAAAQMKGDFGRAAVPAERE